MVPSSLVSSGPRREFFHPFFFNCWILEDEHIHSVETSGTAHQIHPWTQHHITEDLSSPSAQLALKCQVGTLINKKYT
jgi:hypothetical protein